MLNDHQDAYGHEVMDYYRTGHSVEIVEMAAGTGWQIEQMLTVDAGPQYVVVLAKELS